MNMIRPIELVALVVFIVTTTAAAASENVVLGKPVTLNGAFGVGPSFPGAPLAPAWTLTDGKFLPETTWWQSGSVWWDENYPGAVGNSIIIDLLGSYEISSFTVQVDNNDTYRLEYRDASNHWVTAWDIPDVCCFGLMKRTFSLASPISTDALRLTATSGDLLYSVSEIQAFTIEHDDRPVGGLVIDITPQTVRCTNMTTGQAVTLDDQAPAWDCEAAGLGIALEEHVAIRVRGTVEAGATYVGGGNLQVFGDIETPFARYRLTPLETRVLFEAKGWRTVVGFQTRNVPHLGHEYVQKTALTFVDGLFINPVIGRKKAGDFKDEVILRTYEALVHHYYLGERAVLATLHTEMRYAGPREAIFHAIVRKNFGCTHFIVGRDHAGVGNYYAPYAAQEIFDDFPDLGIIPLFFTAFFYCRRCASVANDKTCPHGDDARVQFSGTLLRQLLTERQAPDGLIRPEVADIILNQDNPFVEVSHS